MPAPSTADDLLDLVRKSGVVDAAKLAVAVDRLAAAGELPADAARVADLFVRDGVLTHFQSEQLLQGKWKRFTIGKYKVLERIGAGGMGQVFLCEHKVMRRRVAVKVLPAAKSADPAALERFQREARAVAALDHPNLVRAYDIDQDGDIHFLVMEFVDGPNLQELVAHRVRKTGSGLSAAEACHYIHGAAHGLEHASHTGLVHRDVKPGNILVDRAGRVKVLDLGLARFFHDQADQLTQKFDETTLGTADYIAPEQVTDSHAADVRADLYALGGTFYYLLTGQPPFAEGTVPQKLVWHQTRAPRPIPELRPDVPPGVVAIVEKLLAKNPADRYQTPAELIDALAPWVRTSVSPPATDEFPALSLAAMPASSRVVRSASGSGSRRPEMASAMPTAVAPAELDPAAVWTAVASDTRVATAADTGRTDGTDPLPPPRPKLAPIPPRSNRTNRTPNALLAGVALVVLAGLTYWAVRPKPKPQPGPDAVTAGPAKLYVTNGNPSPNKARTYSTLAAALAYARAGDTIALLDPTWDEGPVRIDNQGKTTLRDVTIESASPTGETVWRVAGPSSDDAALELVDTPNVTIRGLTIDAGQFPVGISINGNCPGLTVDRVTVTHAALTGVRFTNAAGDVDAPITLSRVRVVAAVGAETGIAFRADRTRPTTSVRLHACRVEGPGNQAVLVDGPADGIEISRCRLFNWDAGISITTGLLPNAPLRIALTSNTVYGMKAGGVRVDGDFPKGVKADLALTRNYFAKSREVVIFVNSKWQNLPGLTLTDNGRDKATWEGKLSVKTFEVTDPDALSLDPESDQFLRYPRTSKLAAAGPNEVPVGVPPD